MTLLVHGGAGQEALSPREAQVYRTALVSLLQKDKHKTSARERVIEAVVFMENHSYFNAGLGSALALDGLPYTDASLALSDGRQGAIASSLLAANPIIAAECIMEESKHNLLVGRECDKWLEEVGVKTSGPKTRITKRAKRRLKKELSKEISGNTFATVGAVALDGQGSLAAATSTGGLRGKTPGRVGDSAIFGAGTYCSEKCAISFTGSGEEIMSRLSALRIALALEKGADLEEAVESELASLKKLGAYAGCIALLASGEYYIGQGSPILIAASRGEQGIWVKQMPLALS